jgi:two-component sensor histidine kinase
VVSINGKIRNIDPVKQARRIIFVYLAISSVWILGSDLVKAYFHDDSLNDYLTSAGKGLVFIFISSLVFYYLLKKYLVSLNAANKELKRSEEKYRKLTENIEVGVMRNGTNGRYEYLNPAAWHLLKELIRLRSPDEIPGMLPADIYSDPVVIKTVTEGNDHVLRTGGVIKKKAFFGNKFVSFSKIPEYDPSGKIISVLTLLIDETEILNYLERLKTSESELKESLEEKVVMLKEIHHRVKNNLQVVSSLLNMQLEQTRSEEAREVINSSRNRVKAMAFVHENLYRGGNIGVTKMNEYVKVLSQNIYSSFGVKFEKVRFSYDTGKVEFGLDTIIPLGLIMNEAISNSLMHAFPGDSEGEIKLSLKKIEDKPGETAYILSIKDNGKGMPEEFDAGRAAVSSLGLSLIHSLASQLDGSVNIINKIGTEIQVYFKEPVKGKM